MDQEELLRKIRQIEEHARDGIAEYPNLARERLRMIAALARYIRTELADPRDAGALAGTDSTSSQNDDSGTARSA